MPSANDLQHEMHRQMLRRGNLAAAALMFIAALVVNSWLIPDPPIAALTLAMAVGLLWLSYASRKQSTLLAAGGSLAILVAGLSSMYFHGVIGTHALDQAMNTAVLLPIIAYACLVGSGWRWLMGVTTGALCILVISFTVHGTQHDRGLPVLMYSILYTIAAATVAVLFSIAHRRVLDYAEREAGRARARGAELELAQARLRAFLDAIPSPIYAKDGELRYVDCNAAFCAFVGLPREAIIGRTVLDILPREPAESFQAHDQQLLRSGGTLSLESSAVRADGTTRPAMFHKAVVADHTGAAIGMVGTIVDLSELRSMQNRLIQAEKLEALGRLAGGVAHDMNNQLTGVIGYAELLATRLPAGQDRDDARAIATAAMRAANLPRQLLAYARKGNYLSVPVDMHGLIEDLAGMLTRSIGPGIDLRRHLHAGRCNVLGDPGQLQSMLMNLALNARDAMPEGGELTFTTSDVTLTDPGLGPAADGLAPGSYIRLEIADTGHGMDAAVQRRVFEPFFTTKESGAGTGLGLASVYGAVRNHHGGIALHSEVGRGTTFTILLPLTSVVRPGTPTARPVVSGKQRFLVVDDDDVVRMVIAAQLTRLGHQPLPCSDGHAALALLRDGSPVDGAIIDLLMPGMSGVETFHELRRLRPDLPVIIASGHHDAQEAQGLLDAGARAFLDKPVALDRLAALVGDANVGATRR